VVQRWPPLLRSRYYDPSGYGVRPTLGTPPSTVKDRLLGLLSDLVTRVPEKLSKSAIGGQAPGI